MCLYVYIWCSPSCERKRRGICVRYIYMLYRSNPSMGIWWREERKLSKHLSCSHSGLYQVPRVSVWWLFNCDGYTFIHLLLLLCSMLYQYNTLFSFKLSHMLKILEIVGRWHRWNELMQIFDYKHKEKCVRIPNMRSQKWYLFNKNRNMKERRRKNS